MNENPPDTLLAMIIALGATTAYYALRTGGEEVLVAEQQPLRGWVVATPLSLPRILIGFLLGRFLQTLQAMFLSLPLVLAAYSVGSGTWPRVGWCLVTILAQAFFYQLLGAVLYTTIGQFSTSTFLSLRAALVIGYGVTLGLFPEASHVVVTYELLSRRTLADHRTVTGIFLVSRHVRGRFSDSGAAAPRLVDTLSGTHRNHPRLTITVEIPTLAPVWNLW